MFLPVLPPQFAALEIPRREIGVGERLLLISPNYSHECVVAADGRVRLPNGERVPAVRRTLAEFREAFPRFTSVRRVTSEGEGVTILPGRLRLRVADGLFLTDALRGLPSTETVTILGPEDSATVCPRSLFATTRTRAGDALVLGRELPKAQVSVVGGVGKAGVYEIADSATLGDVISCAGGLMPRALADVVVIERAKRPLGPFALPRDAATPVLAGDVIRVAVSDKIAYLSIAGAVRRPGLIEVAPEMTVAQAIAAAGGLTLPVESLLVSLRSITDPKRKPIRGKASDLSKFRTLQGGDLLEIAPPPPPRPRSQ